jgi:MscS family membrane protein
MMTFFEVLARGKANIILSSKKGRIKMVNRKTIKRHILPCRFIMVLLVSGLVALLSHAAPVAAADEQTGQTAAEEKKPLKQAPKGPVDELDRGVPRDSLKGYLKYARDGDFKTAANYLDFRNLPRWMQKYEQVQLARMFKIVLDRTLWFDLDVISDEPKGNLDDGLPSYRESLGVVKTPERSVEILLQRVPRQDGVLIWKFSNRTVQQLPHLYKYYGYKRFEEQLSKWFPDVTFLGWQSWQWLLFLIAIVASYFAVLIPTWLAAAVLRRRHTEISERLSYLVARPVRILLWFGLVVASAHYIGLSASLRELHKADTLLIIALTWVGISLVDVGFDWWADRMVKSGQKEARVLLRPIRSFARILIVVMAVLVWLDNLGFNINTLLTGLGVGGIAMALAAQDTLKNFIGSVMILLDKPYSIGQRIVIKGHDGIVEEIGLRSTKMRLLTGHQTTVPNEEMARLDIENIGRRPHIRRLFNVTITYDTPPDKIEKAIHIIEKILENHEGMDPDLPPRVYFSEFNPDSLNLMVIYWYHPAAYWDYMAHGQRVNLQIMREFDREGIQFAFPTQTTYLTQQDGQTLDVNLTSRIPAGVGKAV